MIVTHLTLTDFRNYGHADVALGAGVNLFVGRNGQGKTNLVEALGYLSSLGSHRVSSDAALIRAGQDAAIIRTRLHHGGRDLLAEVQINRSGANRAQINRGQIRTRELPRYFTSVLFAPEDLTIVRGDPGARRRFIDGLLALRTPRLAAVFTDYDRVLKQRNTLLKSLRGVRSADAQLATLEVWNDKLIALGTEIIAERLRLVADLRVPLAQAYAAVVGEDHSPRLISALSVTGADADDENAPKTPSQKDSPRDRGEIADAFRAALAERARAERDRGITLVGPHRDDVVFELNGLPVKGYASHGESWSFALALKLAAAEILRVDSSLGDPVLILDDVFAELDVRRRERLATEVAKFEQVLITAAVLEDIPEVLGGHVIHIRAGEIVDPEVHDAFA